jgi:hypothetical protein
MPCPIIIIIIRPQYKTYLWHHIVLTEKRVTKPEGSSPWSHKPSTRNYWWISSALKIIINV